MLCQLFKIFTDDIKNVLSLILLKRSNDLLNHVLSFVIHRKSANVIIFLKVLFDQFEFFCLGNRSNDGLKAPSSFFVAGDINEVLAFYLFQEMNSLMRLQILNHLGAKVVSIVISHQICQLIFNLFNDLVDECSVRWLLQVILQKLRTNFFSSKFHDVSI